MKIRKLYLLNVLYEMAATNLNHHVDNKFYNYFMYNDVNWLIDNHEKITKDFLDNYDKYQFDIAHNYFKYITDFNINELEEVIKRMVEEI